MLLEMLVKALSQGLLGGEKTYVVRGATLQCSQGTDPGVLNMTSSHGVYIKDKPVLSVEDAVCGANISEKYAFGLCKVLQGLPCEPQIEFGAKWTGGKEDVLIEGAPALLSNCTLTCNCKPNMAMDMLNELVNPGIPLMAKRVTKPALLGGDTPQGGGIISIVDDGQDG
ncbi:DUF4280 domain-containing protein [Paenibacillus massiliensis]|uniref:DUF4280 domain-containing protein n=1 Tax=Paenibacillus massiliensis TaxID=225917 RepID=UPI00048EB8CD|nr:DUF4280 domain-containing protein [Paenibacillus massiliensis]